MTQNNKLKNNQITNIFVNNNTGYCSKCLSVLGENRVIDSEGNEFCDMDCRKEYYYEIRREMDSRLNEWLGK